MSTLTRITLGRLAFGAGGGVVLPSLLDVSVGSALVADVAVAALLAQVNQGLVISVAESMLGANVQSPLSVELNTIVVEVDIC